MDDKTLIVVDEQSVVIFYCVYLYRFLFACVRIIIFLVDCNHRDVYKRLVYCVKLLHLKRSKVCSKLVVRRLKF